MRIAEAESVERLTIVHVLTRLLKAGSEENTLHCCRAQAAAGHRVVLVHGRDFDPAVARQAASIAEVVQAPCLVHRIDPLHDILALAQLRRLFADLDAQVVHTHQTKAGIIGRLAARWAGVPAIVHGVHILPWESVSRSRALAYVLAERICARITDAFISVSPSVRDACVARGIGDPSRHFVAFSSIDVDRFKRAEPPPEVRELLGLEPDAPRPPVAVMVAAFERRKRHAEVVRALPAAFAGRTDWRIVFAGEGPEQAAVRALVCDLGLERQVRFVGYRGDPERILAMADVAFLTSEREGLPRVVVQYAAAGKPMVLTELPCLKDVLLGVDSAIVTPTEDVSAAMAAVAALLSDIGRRRELSSAVRRIPVGRWSLGAMAKSVATAYEAAGAGHAMRGAAPRARRSGAPG
jgi:glycosyltransferase involved in cell wall biosynthesis